jgi:hypothetical protein
MSLHESVHRCRSSGQGCARTQTLRWVYVVTQTHPAVALVRLRQCYSKCLGSWQLRLRHSVVCAQWQAVRQLGEICQQYSCQLCSMLGAGCGCRGGGGVNVPLVSQQRIVCTALGD